MYIKKEANDIRSNGFTIVELLIVIVVIALLATMSIVAYNGMQRRAGETVLRSDLRNASKQLAVQNVESGSYPSDLTTANLKRSNKTTYQYTASNGGYVLTGSYDFPGVPTLCVSSTDTTIRTGACPGHTDPNSPGGSTANYQDLIASDNPAVYCRFDEAARTGGSGWQQANWNCAIPGTYKDQSSVTPAWYTQEQGVLADNTAVRLSTGGGAYDMRSTDVNSVRNNMNTWSVEVWVKFSGSAQNIAIVSAEQLWGVRSTSTGFACDHQRSSPWSIATTSSSTPSPTTGTWYYIACTYDNGTLKLYVNGTNVSTSTGATTYNTGGGQMSLGTYNSNWASTNSSQLNGWLDEFAFYKNKTLSAQDIQSRYNHAP